MKINVKELMPEAMDALRFRIIEQAVEDWRYLCAGGTPHHDRNFKELAHFFRNDCDKLLLSNSLTGQSILDRLMKISGAPKD